MAFVLAAGSSVIIPDPIVQGMVVSLPFGVLISTVLTLLVIRLGCVSAGKSLTQVAGVAEEAAPVAEVSNKAKAAQRGYATPGPFRFLLGPDALFLRERAGVKGSKK